MTPVHLSVKIDHKKAYEAHDNLSRLSPTKELDKNHHHLH